MARVSDGYHNMFRACTDKAIGGRTARREKRFFTENALMGGVYTGNFSVLLYWPGFGVYL
jgi:hypothetical protein